jgi:UDP:flavonoid glycosyltransferase YjiC (YdhE family)
MNIRRHRKSPEWGLLCEKLGVGVMVKAEPPEPETIRTAVRAVLAQPAYRMRAQELQRDLKALPALSGAVTRLENLAHTHEPQRHDQAFE